MKGFTTFKFKVTSCTRTFGKNIVILQTLRFLPLGKTRTALLKEKKRKINGSWIFFKRNLQTISFSAFSGELNENAILVKNCGTSLFELLHFLLRTMFAC